MRCFHRTFCVGLLLLCCGSQMDAAAADARSYRQYEVEAGFLYSFLLFSDWEGDPSGDSKKPIVIGILGKSPFQADAFAEIQNTTIKGRPLHIKRFAADASVATLSECRLLFVPSHNLKSKKLAELLPALAKQSVLTVGEEGKFLENGGMVNLLLLKDRVGFEVNVAATRGTCITLRSKLLRLAARVINGETEERTQ